jgi:signal transduction histidine kinase/CheY-like chemotaxis protein
LRFLPEPKKKQKLRWWLALLGAGPGWIIVGALKILAGSFLAVLALNHGLSAMEASDPTQMYIVAFGYLTDSPLAVLALTGLFVVLCQTKINVTNAYAGSIAWSNFFSRLTHSHPGRVVWLFFNVGIALLLMALGVYESLEHILGIYSNVAVAWVGALVADLVVNKPLGLSPRHIEFKRAYLYDINPVGFGSMLLASLIGILAYVGMWGELFKALSPYIALVTAFVAAPIIAVITRGKYYLAREVIPLVPASAELQCVVCENTFDREDIASCPAYGGHICSLCCTLESRCHDKCKEKSRLSEQMQTLLEAVLPSWLTERMNPRFMQFSGLLALMGALVGIVFWLVYLQVPAVDSARILLGATLVQVYVLLLIIVGVLIWLFVLANESRQIALDEATRQTDLLIQEIAAHEKTDNELQQAKELAEAANQAKSRYLGGISHELRSPLNSILGYAQLLEKDKDLSATQLNKVGLIRRSGDHLADLIEGLLDISRIEAGRLEIRRDQVLIRVLLQELVEMFRLQAESKGIQFHYHPCPYMPEIVSTDEKHLRQILINLLSNAVKFTSEGSVSLSVRYRSQVAEFYVDDTGPGITENEQQRIFQPFERIRKPGIPQMPGTGLGLTISQLLADIMGGEITLKSKPQEGSEFRLALMLSSVTSGQYVAAPVRQPVSYEGDPCTVMVVDDNPSHRGLVSEILVPLGFVVLEATDGFDCLESLEGIKVDAFLLDISMPGMTGWELLKRLRSQGVIVPVIMVSADAEDRQSAATQGGGKDNEERLNDDYLIKPIRDTALLEKLGNVLGLTWLYAINEAANEATKVNVEQRNDSKKPDIKASEAREIISLSELGYVAGVEQVLARMTQRGADPSVVNLLNQYLTSYQFNQIISISKKVLSYEQS